MGGACFMFLPIQVTVTPRAIRKHDPDPLGSLASFKNDLATPRRKRYIPATFPVAPLPPRKPSPVAVEFRSLRSSEATGLAEVFAALAAAGDDRLFHPHPMTRVAAGNICRGMSQHGDRPADEYQVAIDHDGQAEPCIVAYGILRGWSEGYAVPSLGIAVHPDHRGRGIARRLMAHLHDVAARRGAERVRLKVYRHNTQALGLYQSLGYEFEPHSDTELLGFFTITHPVAG